jgi:hypothetical protein
MQRKPETLARGSLPGPSRRITVEPIQVPVTPPREEPAAPPVPPEREPVPDREPAVPKP